MKKWWRHTETFPNKECYDLHGSVLYKTTNLIKLWEYKNITY